MSAALSPADALARGPGWQVSDSSIEPLLAGLTNRLYSVRHQGQRYVLRLDAEHTQAFGVDRKHEQRVLKAAEAAGIGPRVVFMDAERGVLVTEYIDGEPWSSLNPDAAVEQLALLLRTVHQLPLTGQALDPVAAANHYLLQLAGDHPQRFSAEQTVELLQRLPRSDTISCCHNDLIGANIIGRSPRLIDWEYACDNDPAFDLATVIEDLKLNPRQSECLLVAYGGELSELRERVAVQRQVYLGLSALWFLLRASLSGSTADSEQAQALFHRLKLQQK